MNFNLHFADQSLTKQCRTYCKLFSRSFSHLPVLCPQQNLSRLKCQQKKPFPIHTYNLLMQSIQTISAMPATSVSNKDSCHAANKPSFNKGLEELRDAALFENKQSSIVSSLATELNQLSSVEREKVYHDLHGVADVVEERPEFVDKCLADLECEICRLEDDKKNAYEMAKKVNPEYICGRGFRLKFLRAEHFVSKNAATRLVGFLEEKLELFGPKPLARELLLTDLNQDDMVLLRSGYFSIVPLRDRAGRVVTVIIPFFRQESTLKIRVRTRKSDFNGDLDVVITLILGSPFSRASLPYQQMRATMYMLSVLAQDEETQMKGCVGIFMNMNPFRRPVELAATFSLTNLILNLAPVRYVGYHFCSADSQQSAISKLESIFSSAPQSGRVRFRYHSGTSTMELDLGLTLFASIYKFTFFSTMLFCRFFTGNQLRSNDLWDPYQGTASDRSRRSGLAASL
jgi:hypothetical protein